MPSHPTPPLPLPLPSAPAGFEGRAGEGGVRVRLGGFSRAWQVAKAWFGKSLVWRVGVCAVLHPQTPTPQPRGGAPGKAETRRGWWEVQVTARPVLGFQACAPSAPQHFGRGLVASG